MRTLKTIAADSKHLGAEIGFFAVLHTWGQNLLHHPCHVDTTLFGDITVWQTNAAWVPADDLRFRVGMGTARRVPAITEAFGGRTATALEVTDPCDGVNGLLSNPTVAANCRALGLSPAFRQASALIFVDNGGNPHLQPEASRNVNGGLLIDPRFLSNLTLEANYYRIRVRNGIDSLADYNPSYIPDACFTSVALSSSLCRMITRTPSGPSAGQISQIEAPDQYIQEAGSFPNLASGGSLTRLRGFFAAVYDTGRWTATWNVRYIGPATMFGEDPSSPFARAPGIFYDDVSAAVTCRGLDVEIGVDNLANQKPPTLVDGVTNTNPATYDVVGRYLYLRAGGKW